LRNIQSNQIESLENGPLYNEILFAGGSKIPHGPLKSDDELWNEMAGNIKQLPQEVQDFLRKKMPSAQPYTFTHGDLSQVNIMVKGTKLAGILDWECSGYYPRWWEFVRTLRGETKSDVEWKAILREHMECDGGDEAAEVWKHCFALRNYPKMREDGKEILAALYVEAGVDVV
jgi:aminoglycoside phosphotransferase (APT) family kinase protein